MRRAAELLMIYLAFILQCTLFKVLSLGGVSPNLLIILTAFFGFMCGKEEGMYAGFFAGLLMDVLYGNGIIGLYALIFVWIGYICGAFSRLFFPEDVVLPIFLTTAGDLLYGFISFLFLFLLRSRLDFFWYLLHIILPEAVYTMIMTMILFKPVLFIEQALEVPSERNAF